MSATYRKDRYTRGSSHKKESTLKVFLLFGFCLLLLAALFWQMSQSQLLNDSLTQKQKLVLKMKEELSILRTFNPYGVANQDIIQEAAISADIFPGWVTRVYPLPKEPSDIMLLTDIGAFILNETQFTLSSHKRYGIKRPNKGMYRLSGIFPSSQRGRLQIGVELAVVKDNSVKKAVSANICSCYVRIDLNNKRVIDQRINMMTNFETERVVTGTVELSKGLYPISALIYCDEKSDFHGDDVKVSFAFRNTSQASLVTHRNAVFHIYQPQQDSLLLDLSAQQSRESQGESRTNIGARVNTN